MTIGFDFGHALDLEFSRSNIEFAISQPKMVRLPQNEKQTYRLNSRPQMWRMGLNLTITLTFEFWRSNVTLTFDHTDDLDHGFSWSNFEIVIPPTSTKLKGGYTGITLSVCLSVRPSVCPSVDKIVSALYLQQFSSDPFHICTSYQATKEGVSRVNCNACFKIQKFEILANFLNL